MGRWWTWLFSLLSLFVTSFCMSEENEIYIWNKIALINESNDGKWLAVFQSRLPNVKQVNTRYENETCKKIPEQHQTISDANSCFPLCPIKELGLLGISFHILRITDTWTFISSIGRFDLKLSKFRRSKLHLAHFSFIPTKRWRVNSRRILPRCKRI